MYLCDHPWCIRIQKPFFKDVKPLLYDTLRTSATSLFALATANALGQLLSYYNVSTSVQQMFATYFPYKWQFLLAVIGFYLFLGTFMDAIPAMILFVPVLMPVANCILVLHPVQLGLIIVITLGSWSGNTALWTVSADRRKNFRNECAKSRFKAVIPYIMVSVVVVVLIAFLPDIAFALPKLIKPEWVLTGGYFYSHMFSRNLSVSDFVRRFFVSCAQISEAYAVCTVMKFGCDWRKIGHKGRCRKDSERTFISKGGIFHGEKEGSDRHIR